MKPSDTRDVCKMYDDTAEAYSSMMDQEIQLPVYTDVLGRLKARIAGVPGTLVDVACGSGHMLSMYRERFDGRRALVGTDLSPRMVAIAEERLGAGSRISVCDMRDLSTEASGAAAAVLSFFALHHLDEQGVREAAKEWLRVLCTGGQLVVAAWEGTGPIDYGDESDIVALRYTAKQLRALFEEANFSVQRCVVEPVEDFPMDAVYLECSQG